MEAGSLWVRLGLNNSNFKQGLQESEGHAKSFDGVMKNALGTAIGFGAVQIGNNIIQGFKSMVAAGMDYNSYMENSSVAWETLLGSGDKAKKMLADIESFAAKTPFEKLQVDQMAKYMNNAGYEGQALFDQLTKIGDMGGAFNIQGDSLVELARQYSQVKQAGVAYTEDLNILADRGVPIYKALSEQLGINVADVKKWASEGKISADVYEKAMNNVAEGVAGGMDKQSKTFTGMVSSLKDGMSQAAGMMAQPIFDKLKVGVSKAMDAVNYFITCLKSTGDPVTALGLVIDQYLGKNVGDVFFFIYDGAKAAFGWIRDNWAIIRDGVVALGTAFITYKTIMAGVMIAQEIHNGLMLLGAIRSGGLAAGTIALEAAQGSATVAQWALNAAMTANPVGLVIAAIAALGFALYELVTHWKEVCTWIENAWNWLKTWNGEPMESKTATMTINEYKNALEGPTPGNARGTNHWRGGLTWVNEEGGELMNLPNGTQIIPHDVSMEMARAAGSGGKGKSFVMNNYGPVYMRDPNEAKQNLQSAMFAAAF